MLQEIPFYALNAGTFVFHEDCEGLEGVPSAIALDTPDMGKCVHCFNCKKTIFASEIYRPDLIIYDTNERKISAMISRGDID